MRRSHISIMLMNQRLRKVCGKLQRCHRKRTPEKGAVGGWWFGWLSGWGRTESDVGVLITSEGAKVMHN